MIVGMMDFENVVESEFRAMSHGFVQKIMLGAAFSKQKDLKIK